jgi:ATP-binding cassette subfamily B protein
MMKKRDRLRIIPTAMKGDRFKFAAAIFSVMAASFFSLVDPIVIRIALDSTLGGGPVEAPAWARFALLPFGGAGSLAGSLAVCALAIVSLNAIQGVFLFLKGALANRAAEGSARRLRERLFAHLRDLPYRYFSKADSGDLIQRCTSDVDSVKRFLEGQIIEVGRAVFMIAFSASILVSLDPRMAAVSMFMVPPIFIWSFLYFLRIQKAERVLEEAESAMTSVVQENLRGIRVVRAFARGEYEKARFDAKNGEHARILEGLIKMHGTYWGVSVGMSMLQMAVTLVVGSLWAVKGAVSMGTVIMFFAYVGRFLWPVRQMGRVLTEFGKTIVALERMGKILGEPGEYRTDGSLREDIAGHLEFRNVSFEHEPGRPVLSGLSFSVRAGETVAILGRTGSGKSSLVHLIPRLSDVSSGAVLIDGVDVRAMSKGHLRSKVGIVLQEPFLYSRSLGSNVCLGMEGAGREELEEAARTAGLAGVVAGFEDGWETPVGEEGVTLSGGQRQRAAIARILLRKPRILILDDSFSAVDTETDAYIRGELGRLKGSMTVIVIAHRITTLAGADRILVMDGGRIADQGTHAELSSREGLYRSIWKLQSAADEEEGIERLLGEVETA